MTLLNPQISLGHRRVEDPNARRHGMPLMESPLYWKVTHTTTHGPPKVPEPEYRLLLP